MDSNYPLDVYTAWPWNPHGQDLLWTVNSPTNTFIQLLIGLWFGFAQPYLERVVAHVHGWICYWIERRWDRTDNAGGPEATDERTPLVRRQPRGRKWVAKVSSWLIIIFGIAWQIAGTFVTILPTGKVALSGSQKCGLWGLRDNALPGAQDEDALLQGQRETRAGQYARNCYGPQSATSLDQCLTFSEPYIPTLRVERQQQCPFQNETYCTGHGFSAVKFTTGLVDARFTGVNAADPPKFNRTMMCVPLNIDQGFVEKTSDQAGHWGYNLGPVSSDEYTSNYTFRQYGDPFTFDVRSYTVSTYVHVYSKSTSQNYWTPIPELNIRPALKAKSAPYSLTLLFINSCRIFYKEESSDPIFPAEGRWPRDPNLWTNYDSRARPLACIDWIEVCPSQGRCRPPYEDEEDHGKTYVFTRYALNKSTTFHTIEFRGATGLDAQDRIQGDTSLPLDKDPPQWIVESWGLFNTSLSRVQYDALDIANGTGWDEAPRYDQKMPTWAQGNVCGIFKFQLPKGYENIKVGTTFGLCLIPVALLLIGMETRQQFSDEMATTGWFGEDHLIGGEKAMDWLVGLRRRCWRTAKRTIPEVHDTATQNPAGDTESQTDNHGMNYGSTSRAGELEIRGNNGNISINNRPQSRASSSSNVLPDNQFQVGSGSSNVSSDIQPLTQAESG